LNYRSISDIFLLEKDFGKKWLPTNPS